MNQKLLIYAFVPKFSSPFHSCIQHTLQAVIHLSFIIRHAQYWPAESHDLTSTFDFDWAKTLNLDSTLECGIVMNLLKYIDNYRTTVRYYTAVRYYNE